MGKKRPSPPNPLAPAGQGGEINSGLSDAPKAHLIDQYPITLLRAIGGEGSRLLTVTLLMGLAIVLAGCGESARSAATAPTVSFPTIVPGATTATSSFPTVAPAAPTAAARFATATPVRTTATATPSRAATTTSGGRAPRVTRAPADSAAKPATKQAHE